MSSSPNTAVASAAAAREKLKAVLDPADRYNSYWDALTQFLRLELSKAEFDRIAVGALGAHVALHNDLIMALLRDAQRGPPPELPFKTAQPMVVGDSASCAPLAGTEVSVPESAPTPKLQGEGEAASSLVAAGAAPAVPSAPKLMLKIKADGGGNLAASLQGPAVNVDPKEEEQVSVTVRHLACVRVHVPRVHVCMCRACMCRACMCRVCMCRVCMCHVYTFTPSRR